MRERFFLPIFEDPTDTSYTSVWYWHWIEGQGRLFVVFRNKIRARSTWYLAELLQKMKVKEVNEKPTVIEGAP
jgi:hypothetical protein